MRRLTESTPSKATAEIKSTLRQRAFLVCYLTAVTIAMLGWIAAFSLAAVWVAELLLT
jgi:hypothetical protein